MLSIIKWLPRVAAVIALSACADGKDPVSSTAAAPNAGPSLGVAPTPDEIGEMPPEFMTSPAILDAWTDAGFVESESRAYAMGFMKYLATNATQEVTLDLRFENDPVGTRSASGESADLLPYLRTLWTTATMGVSGSCGHLVDGSTVHKAWHQFLGAGWKFFSWGTDGRSSSDSKAQSSCEPPPPPPPPTSGGGDGDEYQGGCELCQQWFYFIDGFLMDEWWECTSIPDYYCEGLMT